MTIPSCEFTEGPTLFIYQPRCAAIVARRDAITLARIGEPPECGEAMIALAFYSDPIMLRVAQYSFRHAYAEYVGVDENGLIA